ncbi:MAG: tRNA epoxyqueuosine(34) reductase QueG [Bacteroidota bacterium]
MFPSQSYSSLIKAESLRLGFDFCGFSKADFLEEEAPRLEQWLLQNMHGKMKYMENYFDKRLDPRKLVDGARTVISLIYNYYPSVEPADVNAPKISKYAYGKDYHIVLKEKLAALMNFISESVGDVNGRAFVDSAPVLDRAWAKKSGLGWIGKNTNLITREHGSFFFIAELIIDLEIEPDGPIEDFCGTCTACIDSCPTEAIIQPYVVDGSKCISYFTIELKEEIPLAMKGKFSSKDGDGSGWAFGCDICQDVCPWNRFSKPHKEPAFNPSEELLKMKKKDWEEITEDVFKKIFSQSAVKRTGYKGLLRNLKFINETF